MADLAELIMGDVYNLNTFSRAIQEAGLVQTLKSSGSFTVFAPTDEAFTKLPKSTLDELFNNKARLKAVVNYHIIPESLSIDDIRHLKNDTLTTQQGQLAKVDTHRWHLHLNPKINGISITDRKDVAADNGVLHEIDAVMMPNLDLTCPTCGKGFLNQNDVDTHTSTAHKEPIVAPKQTVVHQVEHKVAPVAAAVAAPAVVAPLVKKAQTSPKKHHVSTVTTSTTKLKDTMVYEILYDDDNQKYVYHLKDSSGEIIGESRDFRTLDSLKSDISLVKTDAPIAKIICAEPTSASIKEETGPIRGPVFEQFKDECGQWRFNLKDTPESRIILTSRKGYDSISASNNGIDKLRDVAPKAKIIYPEEAVTHKITTSKEEILAH
ncbi:MAG: fasciclin domain-containing protein [Nitrososphaerota archaeon]|jgi:uncharacterized surface protein with fasciclin (FAS1) repeats/uncharacterized protein YegP (UPF0339 family)|nr:fasciclin domain-containing protein [Nitrososphaerota archaeon]